MRAISQRMQIRKEDYCDWKVKMEATAKESTRPEGRTSVTKVTTEEIGDIKIRRGGDNQPVMKNGGDKGNSEGELIVAERATQLTNNESLQRVGGNIKEES